MSNEENMFYRDGKLSLRHRLYGCDVPMTDLDFVCCEYDRCQPLAIVEYKHCNADPNTLRQRPGVRVIRALADRAGIAAWVALYDPNRWVYTIMPLNEQAQQLFGARLLLNERQYVEVLYRLRKTSAPLEILSRLSDTIDRSIKQKIESEPLG